MKPSHLTLVLSLAASAVARLFVSNLPIGVHSSDLKELFEKYGTVEEAHVVKDRETGISRGYGFVTLDTKEDEEAAVKGLNEKMYRGREIRVKVVKDRNGNDAL